MNQAAEGKQYLIAKGASGTLVLRISSLTVTWVPWDVVNEAFNVTGIVTVGSFESFEEAKRAGEEQYSIPAENWILTDQLPFEDSQTEFHGPDVDGHRILRHGIHWK